MTKIAQASEINTNPFHFRAGKKFRWEEIIPGCGKISLPVTEKFYLPHIPTDEKIQAKFVFL